jgi:hypothetical protein
MQHAAARQLREDDHDLRSSRPARRLQAVEDLAAAQPVDDGYAPVYAENGRRTVTITGHPVPARRRASPTQSQIHARPDRIALWAFLLGLFLVFMAVATAHASAL